MPVTTRQFVSLHLYRIWSEWCRRRGYGWDISWCRSVSDARLATRKPLRWIGFSRRSASPGRPLSTAYHYSARIDLPNNTARTATPGSYRTILNRCDCCRRSEQNIRMFTQRRRVSKSVGCFQRRLFVCLFVNTITSERVNIGRWNLGVGALYKNLGRVRIWGS